MPMGAGDSAPCPDVHVGRACAQGAAAGGGGAPSAGMHYPCSSAVQL